MGSLEASCILTPGRPDPHFGGVSGNFPEFFFWVKFVFEGQFFEFFYRKYIFELPLRMICLLMGISMVVIFSQSDQKWPNGGHFSCQKCIYWAEVLITLKR